MPRFELEAVLLAGLCAVASLLVHVLLFVVIGGPAPREPTRLLVELRAPAAALPAAASSPTAPAPLLAAAPEEHDVDGEKELIASPRDRRALLRKRDAAFVRDMQVRAQRIAALRRHEASLAGPGPQPTVTTDPPLRRCDDENEEDIAVEGARSMAVYADLTPVGLFPPRYLERVWQVQRTSSRRLGFIEMALPAEELVVQLDEPRDAVFVIGHRDMRCLVGFSWSPEIFPLTFRGIPARFIDADDVITEVAIDVSLQGDASFEVTQVRGPPLPFTRGALYDRNTVARNLQQRAMGARVLRDFLGALFGAAP